MLLDTCLTLNPRQQSENGTEYALQTSKENKLN